MDDRRCPSRLSPMMLAAALLAARAGAECLALRGDCNGDGRVSIGELQRATAMRAGTVAPACGVDADGGGTVSADELAAVVDSFLGVRAAATVAIEPPSAIVGASGAVAFAAAVRGCGDDAPVAWSVQEAGGGTVTAAGAYTAPAAPGTYHVVATVQGDASVRATAAVLVVAAVTLTERAVSPSASDQT